MISVRGACLMCAAKRLTKRSRWSLSGLGRRRRGQLLVTLSLSGTGPKSCFLMSLARRCHHAGSPLGLWRLVPPCSAT